MKDAWQKHDDLVKSLTKVIETRPDITVIGNGWDRSVYLGFDSSADFTFRPHNVRTMRKLAKALNDACDYVEEVNPKWAAVFEKDK